jgi:hypothetical protein
MTYETPPLTLPKPQAGENYTAEQLLQALAERDKWWQWRIDDLRIALREEVERGEHMERRIRWSEP